MKKANYILDSRSLYKLVDGNYTHVWNTSEHSTTKNAIEEYLHGIKNDTYAQECMEPVF